MTFVRHAIVALTLMATAVAFPQIGIGASMAPVSETGQARSPEIRALLEHLQRHYQETSTLSAKFTQTVTHAGGMTRTRTGTLALRKPGQMRWEFTGEQPETIVSDGETIFDYDPGLNQVVESPLKQAFRTSAAAAFLLGVGNVERDFNAAAPASTPSDDLRYVTLTPKGGGDRIEVGINANTFDIETLKLEDGLGNTTALRFTDTRTNVPLAASLFTFRVPQGADIVGSGGPP
ncbi:MAG: outer membrane lipoprotein chaperone LolA [Candidatus Binataceae bacterium]